MNVYVLDSDLMWLQHILIPNSWSCDCPSCEQTLLPYWKMWSSHFWPVKNAESDTPSKNTMSTSSRSLEHRHSRCTHVQVPVCVTEYVKLTPHWQLAERVHKRCFCQVIGLAFVCAHGSSYIFLYMKMSPGRSRHHLPEGVHCSEV